MTKRLVRRQRTKYFYKQYLLPQKPISTVYKILLFREKCSATWKGAVVFKESK